MDIIQDDNTINSCEKTVDSLEDISQNMAEETTAEICVDSPNEASEERTTSQTKESEIITEPTQANMGENKNSDVMSKSCLDDCTNMQKSQAFTIDFGDGKQVDSSKHKFLLEKLKKRHQRGASLSKLDEAKNSKSGMTKSKTSGTVSKLAKSDGIKENISATKNSLKMSPDFKTKPKMPMSVSFHESSNFALNSSSLDSKSLSPHTSFHEHYSDEENMHSLSNISTRDKALESPHMIKSQLSSFQESESDVIKDCIDNDSCSDVSETGTYTIENDTYTEEQKAKMSIDQKHNANGVNIESLSRSCDNNVLINDNMKPTKNISTSNTVIYSQHSSNDFSTNEYPDKRLTNGHKQYTPNKVSSDKNVLEVSYYYEPQVEDKVKTRSSVLEKLKNRVRNISERTINHKPKQVDNNLDVGSFTSVTASGVLSNKNSHTKNKNEFGIRNELDILLKRKKSLTKTEIESSDYVEPEVHHRSIEPCEPVKPAKSINKFENNWIYEWAKSASEHNRRHRNEKANNQNYLYDDNKSNNNSEFYGDKQNSNREMSLPLGRTNNDRINDSLIRRPPRPPASPTKIPSPISTLARPRSRNSVSLSGSTTELNSPVADTHSYLRNTEDVINILARSLSSSTGPKMSNYATYSDSRNGSPMHSLDSSSSPKHISYVTISSDGETRLSQNQDYNTRPIKSESSPTSPQRIFGPTRHKRHFSFDNSLAKIDFSATSQNRLINNTLSQKNNLSKAAFEHSHNLKIQHDYVEKNNKDLGYGDQLPPKPIKCFINKNDTNSKLNIDQTISVSKDNLLKNTFNKAKDSNLQINNKNSFNDVKNKLAKHQNSPTSSPIRRSSSFSTHINDTPPMRSRHNNTPFMDSPRTSRKFSPVTYNNYQDDNFSDSIKSDYEYDNDIERSTQKPEKIKNTRCNRAFSLRRARLDSEKSDASKQSINKTPASNFVRSDFKNNADTQRRSIRSSFRDKSVGPRDVSVKRTTNNKALENSNDNNASAGQKKPITNVQPRYMDISKYKAPTSATFLKKDESKSYLETKSVPGNSKNKSLIRNDDIRLSLRSTRSAGPAKGVIKKDIVPVRNPNKEQEMANWKRRAKYDPMKAAAEGRKKAELAKKIASSNIMTQSFNENENCAPLNSGGAVLRSQSYHGTVGLEWLSSGNSKTGFNRSFNRGESISDTSDDGINFT